MPRAKSSFVEKVLGRLGRLDTEGLQTVVQRLARERTFLETLFNAIEDGVLVVDEQAQVVYANQSATRLLGLQTTAIEGEPIGTILPEIDWKKIIAHDKAGGNGVRMEFEVEYPRPRYLRLYAAPLDGDAPGTSGVALILHDATESRQQTYEAIESERIQALTLLAASVAHEIGNPLNALHIHLQLMEREVKKIKTGPASPVSTAKLENYLDVAKGEINRLDYIITQFLQAIRPSAPQLKPTSLNDVAQKTVELLRPELDNRRLHVKTKLARRLPAAPLDAAQLEQVLVNLIKNAMHAMTTGGVLTLATGESSEGVWISVADTGGGIPQEQINRIFDPFYTTKKEGTGLGLMIVQRILRAHGGRIELESNVGKGTTFRLWLPLHERKPRLLEAPTPS